MCTKLNRQWWSLFGCEHFVTALDCDLAVQTLLNLYACSCVADSIYSGKQLQRLVPVADCVISCNQALLLEAQHPGKVEVYIQGAVSHFRLFCRNTEAFVEAG